MIKIEHTNPDMLGIADAFRGMRNPYDSWSRSDSVFPVVDWLRQEDGSYTMVVSSAELSIGPKDMELACRLINGGSEHRKFLRMMAVKFDVVAPFYWWKEMDTYKVGTVANSCSTMHKLPDEEITMADFSFDEPDATEASVVEICDLWRSRFRRTKEKADWRKLIQLLPMGYNQRRTMMMDYETLIRIYFQRKDHNLPEWHEFCSWIKGLPYMVDFLEVLNVSGKA